VRRLFRLFPFYLKKRGARRTGSAVAGNAGMTLFFAALFFAGWCFSAVVFTVLALPEWRVNREFVETTCQVIRTRVVEKQTQDATTYRPEAFIEYKVGTETKEAWAYDVNDVYLPDENQARDILADFVPGETYTCWYDPKDPANVVLKRGFTPYVWLMLLLPLAFIFAGGAGLIWTYLNWGTSAEHRAALAKTAARLAPADRQVTVGDHPYVPHDLAISDSPGTVLAFRLPTAGRRGLAITSLVFGMLLFMAMVCVFVTLAIHSVYRGEPQYSLIAAAAVFALVAWRLLSACLRALRRFVAVGQSICEISDHPLFPGEQYTLYFSQSGRARWDHLRLYLACDEKALFQQGTNSRLETRRVFEDLLLDELDLTTTLDVPYENELHVIVPAGVMHSFRAAHNEVVWQLVLEGSSAGIEPLQRRFPVIVYPEPAE
jgi:hypothetical protein